MWKTFKNSIFKKFAFFWWIHLVIKIFVINSKLWRELITSWSWFERYFCTFFKLTLSFTHSKFRSSVIFMFWIVGLFHARINFFDLIFSRARAYGYIGKKSIWFIQTVTDMRISWDECISFTLRIVFICTRTWIFIQRLRN